MAAMTLAGGVAAALYRRATQGEAPVVDVALLNVGMWQVQRDILSAQVDEPNPPERTIGRAERNPLTGSYRTKDRRFISLAVVNPEPYWEEFCAAVGTPDLAADERFATIKRAAAARPGVRHRPRRAPSVEHLRALVQHARVLLRCVGAGPDAVRPAARRAGTRQRLLHRRRRRHRRAPRGRVESRHVRRPPRASGHAARPRSASTPRQSYASCRTRGTRSPRSRTIG